MPTCAAYGDRVVLLDEVFATGGTANAACELIEKLERQGRRRAAGA